MNVIGIRWEQRFDNYTKALRKLTQAVEYLENEIADKPKEEILDEIETELDNLLLPYKIDLSLYHKIENKNLIDHIKRIGLVFYEKQKPR